jgi:hypothetical protein
MTAPAPRERWAASLSASSPSRSSRTDSPDGDNTDDDSPDGNSTDSATNAELDRRRRDRQSRWAWRFALALGFILGIACSAVAPLITEHVSYAAQALELLVDERLVEFSGTAILVAECASNATRSLKRPLPHPDNAVPMLYYDGVDYSGLKIRGLCHNTKYFPSRPDIQQLCDEFDNAHSEFRRIRQNQDPSGYSDYQGSEETQWLYAFARGLQSVVERQRANDGDTDDRDPGLPETPEARLLRRRHTGEVAVEVLTHDLEWRRDAAKKRAALASLIHNLIVMENKAPYIVDAFAYEIRGKRGAGLKEWYAPHSVILRSLTLTWTLGHSIRSEDMLSV